VPFGWAVCFPDQRNIYSKKQIPAFLDPIRLLESSALQAIEKQIPLIFHFIREQNAHMQGAGLETYHKLKASLLAGLGMVVPLHARLEAEERQLIQLTAEQMQLLELIGHNKRLLVSGPAGCGKTIMATTIARQAREEGLRVLMLTFNRIPAVNIRLGLGLQGNEPDITIDNYHHFAHRIVEEVQPGWWDASAKAGGDDFWEIGSAIRFDEVLQQREQQGLEPSWDVIIIDEGQDFRESWLLSLSRLLKPAGRLYIFMDEDQNIFNAFTGLPADWQFASFRLPRNCRNTRRIIELLEQYLGKDIPCRESTPDGEPVQLFQYRNEVEQVKLVRDRWLQLVSEEGISPARIVLILNTPKEESCLAKVNAFGHWPIQAIDRDTGLISPTHVNITTIRTFKGLEADMVFILDTDKMPQQDPRVLYTQASRAKLWLGVMENE
jgi:superfamily I DNA/RNA helicase